MRRGVRVARGGRLVRPSGDGGQPGSLADVRRRPALLRGCADEAGRGNELQDDTRGVSRCGRLRPRLPRSLPDADHVGRVVDRLGARRRVPGRLPAEVPRQPWADRPRQGAPVADDHGGVDVVRRPHRGTPRTGRRSRGRPGGRRRSDRAIRRRPDGRRHQRHLRRGRHGHPRRRRAARPRRRGPQGAGRAGLVRILGEPGGSPHRCEGPASPGAGVGLVERRAGGLPAATAPRSR